jgi:hypothetical protein
VPHATAPLLAMHPEAKWATHARFGAILAPNLAVLGCELLASIAP